MDNCIALTMMTRGQSNESADKGGKEIKNLEHRAKCIVVFRQSVRSELKLSSGRRFFLSLRCR